MRVAWKKFTTTIPILILIRKNLKFYDQGSSKSRISYSGDLEICKFVNLRRTPQKVGCSFKGVKYLRRSLIVAIHRKSRNSKFIEFQGFNFCCRKTADSLPCWIVYLRTTVYVSVWFILGVSEYYRVGGNRYQASGVNLGCLMWHSCESQK